MSNVAVQVKFTIDSDIVSMFKTQCASVDASMTSVIRQFMVTYQPTKAVKCKSSSRPLRRKTVFEVIGVLRDVMQWEEDYRDNIPESFQSRIDMADQACEKLADAIYCLEDAF